nr:hypothetical protein [Tanacetum cinerariifolium]GEY52495.1 hypothetical protein [Tanacetum cinerariifolium]
MNTQTTSPTTTFPQPYITPNDDVSPHHNTQHTSPSSSTSSVIIVMIVISSAIILTATIYFTIRYISRRTSNDVVSANVNLNNEHVPHDSHHVTEVTNTNNDVDSLPLFTFSSLTGDMMTSGDCAVCLSKFESEDQLRLLPLCCHAFHAFCIDAWLKSNFTCPLCRSNVNPTEADISRATGASRSNSFRIEIGSISNRREPSGSRRRSYSVGSFEYVVDIDGYEVSVESTRRRGESDGDKESTTVVVGPGENVAAEVGSGRRNWLRRSLRGSGRLFSTGSSRRSENVVDERIGEEISEFFRWFSGV